MDFLQNQRNHYIKKNIFEILKERFSRNENLLDRILHYTVTEKDIKDLNQFVADIYEVAYLKCVDDHKKKFEELGYQVKVTADHSKDGV
jgi:hypothetical protein